MNAFAPFPAPDEQLAQRLRTALGDDSIRTGTHISDKYLGDWSGEKGGRPAILALPRNTDEVSRILGICHAAHHPVVPQGGLTGLAGGAVPQEGAVALSLERMNGIVELDADSATVTVLAGTPLQTIQEAAAAEGFLCGLDLGARGSCQIGGNISTNAGGNRVIRYGMTRDLVLGLEVVLPDGTVLPMMNKMSKNNTGPDLKQLFIGAEGTLGIVTRAVLRLHPGISGANTALVALGSFDDALKLLRHARQSLSGLVSAFELMWADYYRTAIAESNARAPLAADYPLYVLMDMQSAHPEENAARFEAMLEHALSEGWARDVAIAQSHADAENFWALRDGVGEMLRALAPTINFDVSVPVSSIGLCVQRMRNAMESGFPGIRHMYFGHIADGNVHIVVGPLPQDEGHTGHEIERAFYAIVRDLSGSVSAEHGIGLHKRPWLAYSRSPAEIHLIRILKQALDPHGIMNPGKIITT
uniref:FAD-binding oxidoreductase n=1 Tax=Castellaniella defragrans TaxID=75697 RepID=UPI00333ECAED